MSASDGFIALLQDLLAGAVPFEGRRMFGGAGLFSRGVMFAIVIDDALYLKADAVTATDFEREGLAPFSYARNGRTVALSYWRAPERLFDDPDAMLAWAARALDVARRTAARAPRAASRKRRAS